jgi:hypothetical protein
MSLPLALSVSGEERWEVLACFHVVVKMYRYSLEERVFIVKTYWVTGSIKNCQRSFVKQFGSRNPPSKRCIQLLVKKLILSYLFVLPTSFMRIPKTQPHFITGVTCKCIVLLFFLWTNIFRGYPRVGHTVYAFQSVISGSNVLCLLTRQLFLIILSHFTFWCGSLSVTTTLLAGRCSTIFSYFLYLYCFKPWS